MPVSTSAVIEQLAPIRVEFELGGVSRTISAAVPVACSVRSVLRAYASVAGLESRDGSHGADAFTPCGKLLPRRAVCGDVTHIIIRPRTSHGGPKGDLYEIPLGVVPIRCPTHVIDAVLRKGTNVGKVVYKWHRPACAFHRTAWDINPAQNLPLIAPTGATRKRPAADLSAKRQAS